MKKCEFKSFILLVLVLLQQGQVFCQDGEESIPQEEVVQKEEIKIDGFTKEDRQKLEASTERHEFQAEVGRLLDIIINSLYTQKEIFLREAISNAADALDKIRYMSVTNPAILGDEPELCIRIEFDPKAKTLSITDTGIGMTKSELITNLGTIAKSGTTNFIEAIAKGGNLNLIGQFGVGFYSYFLVANKVTVTSKSNDDVQHVWESTAASSFVVAEDPRGNTMKRGSKVTIHLKDEATDLCEQEKIKSLVKKYSEFINFPIYIHVEKEVTREEEIAEDDSTEDTLDDLDADVDTKDEEEPKKKTKTIREKVWEWELANDSKAIWLRPREEIEEEEYSSFYKSISKDYEDPLTYIHFQVEGEVEFKSILYTPKRAPYDLFDNYGGKSSALKLYVRRVLINDQFEDLIPKYLGFVKGIVDSDDLPLNVNRESLQQEKMLKVMSRKLVRKILEMIRDIAEPDFEDDEEEDEEEDEKKREVELTEEEKEQQQKEKEAKESKLKEKYKEFWKEFGKNIKLGIIEDPGNRDRLAQLCRFYSTHNKDELTSLDNYLERAPKTQEYIYYIGGQTREAIMNNPLLQGLIKKGYEVLLLDDPIDEYAMQHLSEYEKKKLVNIAKGDFKMPEDDNEKKRAKQLKKIYQPLADWWKKLISEQVDTILVSQRLVDDPCAVVASEHGYSPSMERISSAQAFTNPDRGNPAMGMKKILEVNPSHPVIKELLSKVNNGQVDSHTEAIAKTLYETALLNSGFSLVNTHSFAKRLYSVFNDALGIPKDARIEEIQIDLEEEEDGSSGSSNTVDLDDIHVDL